MAIKRPSISKPGIVKPNTGVKKPGITKPVVEEEPKAIVVEEPKPVVVEEEPVQVVQEEANEIEAVVEEEIEIPTDIVVVESEPVVEEQLPAEEPKEEVVEEKPKKASKKKTSKKAKKEEVKEEEQAPVSVESYQAKPLADAMKDMIGITGCTTPEWEQTKQTITEQVQGMHIDPDSTPAEMRYLIADIDAALSELKIRKMNADQQFNPLLKHINYVSLQAGSKGSNSEERKANAIRGLIEYKSNPDDMEYTNLLDIQVYAENQLAFYDEMIKILMDKKNMLITFSGIVKTESQLGSY